ncbi:MAG TPA: NFACT RNA binding domain-containing protein [Cyclobacteriaceae bacterium]|nr:NFACT RNA binding domain-containing protein [Cyclobacteriaceae bacterium]
MHNNYYFLRQLSAQLNEKIVGYSIVSCFSQNKDELIIELNNSRESFFIKANLVPGFCCLSFPNNFHRARKNSVDLFTAVILKKVVAVKQFENERSFSLQLEEGHSLIFKMHNQFANVLYLEKDIVKEIFRNHLQSDFEIIPDQLNRSIDFSKENFFKNISSLSSTYFTFGKTVWDYLLERNFGQLDNDSQWRLFEQTLQLLEGPKYYLIEQKGKLTFSLLPLGKILQEFSDPIRALNEFSDRLIRDQVFFQEKASALHQLRVRLKGSEGYLKKNGLKLNELTNDHHYQLWADLLMANLHNVKTGLEKVSFPSFYDDSTVEIKLKKELNPQKNAEIFYRKAKNQQIEINKLKEAITQKENEILKLKEWIGLTDETSELKELRKIVVEAGLDKKKQGQTETLPFHEFEFKGYKILVGKNAESNDKLTLKYSYKDDLWLHAKDVAGSHVLVKYQSGKNFPKDVIEYAAGLAAYNSKRKNESLCPVAFTQKKFVRKRKGDPAGMVVVEREEVILVEPIKA